MKRTESSNVYRTLELSVSFFFKSLITGSSSVLSSLIIHLTEPAGQLRATCSIKDLLVSRSCN